MTQKKITIKEWFQNKVAKEMGIRMGLHPVAISKETEKAYYVTSMYMDSSAKWHQKTMWIPKSAFEDNDKVNPVTFVETYEEANEITANEIRMAY